MSLLQSGVFWHFLRLDISRELIWNSYSILMLFMSTIVELLKIAALWPIIYRSLFLLSVYIKPQIVRKLMIYQILECFIFSSFIAVIAMKSFPHVIISNYPYDDLWYMFLLFTSRINLFCKHKYSKRRRRRVDAIMIDCIDTI